MSYIVYIDQIVLFVVYYQIISIIYDIIVEKYQASYSIQESIYDSNNLDSSTYSSTDDGYETDVSSLTDDYNSKTSENSCYDMFEDLCDDIVPYIFNDIDDEFTVLEQNKPTYVQVNKDNDSVDTVKQITTTQLDYLTLRKYMKSRCLRGYIAEYQKLSLEFIEEFINDLPVHLISRHQILPESFIRKYYDVLEMSTVSEYQKLSDEFLNEFEPYIEFSFITRDNTTEQGYPCDEHCYQMDHPNFFSSNMECKQCKQEYLKTYEY